MQPQQLNHGLHGRRNMQQRDSRRFARQVLVNTQQRADAGAVEELHAGQVDGHGFDAGLPQFPTLVFEVGRGRRVESRRVHDEMKRRIFQFSLKDGGHASQDAFGGRGRTPKFYP